MLEKQGGEEEHPEQRPADQGLDHVGAAPVAVGEHPQRGKRLGAAPLQQHERGQGGSAGGEGPGGPDVGPAVVSGPGQAEDDQAEPGAGGNRSGQVKPEGLALRGGDEPGGQRGDDGGDGHVDEEHPPPRHRLDQDPAEEEAGGGAEPFHGREHPDGPVPGSPGRERGDDQRQGGGLGERGAGALGDAGGDQQPR